MMSSIDPRTAKVLGQVATQAIAGLLGEDGAWAKTKQQARAVVARDPMDTALATVTGATVLFYLAERRANPKVKTLADALVFITTCLSVGYADVFARTQAGKAIASAVMAVGPSISSNLFAPPEAASAAPASDAGLREIAELQRQILARLDTLIEASKRTPA